MKFSFFKKATFMKTLFTFILFVVQSHILYAQLSGRVYLTKTPGSVPYWFENSEKPKYNVTKQGAPSGTHSIDFIEVYLLDGSISTILISMDNGTEVYRNRITISLPRYSTRSSKEIIWNIAQNRYVYFSDVMGHIPLGQWNTLPDDGYVILRPAPASPQEVNLNRNPKNHLKFKTYTDALALFGDEAEPNGILQTELQFKHVISTRQFINTNLYPLHFIGLSASLTRFDSIFKKTEVKQDSFINRRDLLQRAYLRIGGFVNLLSYLTNEGHRFDFNIGYDYTHSKIFKMYDSSDATVTVSLWYAELPLNINLGEHWEMGWTPSIFRYNINSSDEYDEVKNVQTDYVFKSQLRFQFAFEKEDKVNKIFLRWNLFNNLTDNNQWGFSQVQIGYEGDLTKLFKKM